MSSCNKEECFTFTWKIENISLLTLKGARICSPAWNPESTNENARWYLGAYSRDVGIIIEVYTLETQLKPYRSTIYLLTHSDEVPLKSIHDNRAFSVDKYAITGDNRESIFLNNTLTVCYKMWDKTLKAGEFRTRSEVRKLNYLWDIKNFDRMFAFYSNTIIDKGNIPFYMILNNNHSKSYTHTLLFGGLPNGENSLALSNCKVSFKYEGNALFRCSLCNDNIFRVLFDINTNSMNKNLQLELESIFFVHTNSENAIDYPCILGTDLQHLYKDELYSDVTIQTESKSFSVHKNILAARSPVFRAMFEKDEMREAQSGVVDIKDVDSTTLDHMLAFLYSGSLTGVHWENISSLYYAADKYAVLSLKEKCADILKAGLSVDNACDLLVLTDAHSDQELMEYVVNFILDHQEVVSSPRWEELEKSNTLLTSKIARKLFLSCKRKK